MPLKNGGPKKGEAGYCIDCGEYCKGAGTGRCSGCYKKYAESRRNPDGSIRRARPIPDAAAPSQPPPKKSPKPPTEPNTIDLTDPDVIDAEFEEDAEEATAPALGDMPEMIKRVTERMLSSGPPNNALDQAIDLVRAMLQEEMR